MPKRPHDCMWCPVLSPTAKAHMQHVGQAHADRLFKGRPVTHRPHSCWACARDIAPDVTVCPSCGHVNGSSTAPKEPSCTAPAPSSPPPPSP